MSEVAPPPSTPSPAPAPPPHPAPPPAPGDAPAPQPNVASPPPANSAPPENMWPETWRETYANGDEAKLKALARYDSPAKAFDAILETRRKISTGELKVATKPPGPDATPEQIAAYRAEVGVPESPDKYDTALDNGKVWGEADKPLLESFTKAAHDANLPPGAIKPMLNWYSQMQEKLVEQQADRDAGDLAKNSEFLKEEWGPEFKKNTRISLEFFKELPNGVGDKLLNGRLADGTLIANDPTIIQWANEMRRTLNPAATVVPGSGGNPMAAIDTELANLKVEAGDYSSAYWKGPLASQKQARFRELIEAKERQARR